MTVLCPRIEGADDEGRREHLCLGGSDSDGAITRVVDHHVRSLVGPSQRMAVSGPGGVADAGRPQRAKEETQGRGSRAHDGTLPGQLGAP